MAEPRAQRRATVADLGGGVLRITQPLPWALDHVHCYALTGPEGWTIVDAGLGTPGTRWRWEEVLAELGDPPVVQLVVTHYHPDHLGCADALRELTGAAEAVQGDLDARLARAAWVEADAEDFLAYLRRHGMPDDLAAASASAEARMPVTPVDPTRLVGEGDRLEAGGTVWTILHLPGHADGHIGLWDEAGRRLVGGDVILRRITPNVGRWEDTAPDPLARFLSTLDRLDALAPDVVYPGHHEPIEDVRERTAELRAHHAERLEVAHRALRERPLTAYELAGRIWARDGFSLHEQRFALVEALAHAEHLAAQGRARECAPGLWEAA